MQKQQKTQEPKLKKSKQKHKLFEHKINLKKEDYSDRIITVTGVQRTGKTSFVVAFIRELFKRQNKMRARETNAFIDELNKLKVNNVPCYKLNKSPLGHYIYTAEPFTFKLNKKGLTTLAIDPHRIGVPNNTYDFEYLPYGSIVIVDEADEIFPNREWQDTPPELIELLKYIGHNHMLLIFICQVLGNLDKKIRELTMQHFHIYYREIKPKHWFFREKFIWHILVSYPQELLMMKALKDLGIDTVKPRLEWYKFITKDNPHRYYNSRSGQPLFLRKIKNYNYRTIPALSDLDRESVEKVSEYKSRNKDSEELEKEYDFWKMIEKRAKLKDLKSKYKQEAEDYLKGEFSDEVKSK